MCQECAEPENNEYPCGDDGKHVGPMVESPEGRIVIVEVEARFERRWSSRIGGAADDCYPAGGGGLEELIVTLDGKPFELTKEEENWAIEAAQDYMQNYSEEP
jgi:hypothetical protein